VDVRKRDKPEPTGRRLRTGPSRAPVANSGGIERCDAGATTGLLCPMPAVIPCVSRIVRCELPAECTLEE